MTVDQIYILMKDILAKNIQQGYLSPDEFNQYINQAQRSYTDFLKGEYQKYQIRRPISVVEFGQNQMIRQSLAPLIYGSVLSPNTTTGIAPFPSDYEVNDAMWGLYGHYNIRFVQQDRLDSYLHSEIDPIATNPVYLIQHEGFHFFPENIGSARMSYVRTPPPITWGYDLDANGIPVYNAATSQQPVWSDTDIMQLIVRALSMAGVSIQLGAVIQYSENIKQGGQ
jgi:hypothetical protein